MTTQLYKEVISLLFFSDSIGKGTIQHDAWEKGQQAQYGQSKDSTTGGSSTEEEHRERRPNRIAKPERVVRGMAVGL